MMRAGKLRHRVEIQKPEDRARDSHGGVKRYWTTVATVWASVEPLRGREFYQAQQMESQTTVRIGIRYYAELTPEHRIRLLKSDGTIAKTYNIDAIVDPDEMHVEMELQCIEDQDV